MTLNKKQKIEPDQVNLDKLKDASAENPGALAFPHNVGSAVVKPEDEGRIKGLAMAAMKEQTSMQLKQLYDQIKVLARQAKAIRARVHVSERIYRAQMNFDPVIGKIYYLYEKEEGRDVLSMIAPDEWGRKMPYQKFIAEVRLLSDHTWEVLKTS